ncbi:MAG: hypothetical protein DRR00_23065 [Candidatus Parabeggiatoa sp. nov. 3]|nr:MAG: hypothetical protein DRR00_23065 [Gammaproteobacteria bacterium]
MAVNGPPKTLKPFVDKGRSMGTNSVKVVAKNSPYQIRKVEIIFGTLCDAYVLDDGTADLLEMDQKTLNAVRGNWPPKTLKPFVDKGRSMAAKLIDVAAKNSPYQIRNIL